ncbi:DddA-like double-stranded DNA deaminase toxin [Saccharopolyspora sp. 6V]|uniref:DddA-like double-stranded DNA deaminase toxin n=1 Tax=Saccharopolyspora sp. 6V TaxID=2877239 RepID=UPI001CD1D8A7|nr:DddA-like double-stranded DNA deaminase toxin [Saccharopolyspora sp. 6V]MCA1195147.1 hypothetical protein [Saccharopolyspora sp. 6V]
MTSVGDLGAALGQALAALNGEALLHASNALDDAISLVLYSTEGATDPAVAEAVTALQRAQELIRSAAVARTAAGENVAVYLAGVGWLRHGDRPPSLPHPSTYSGPTTSPDAPTPGAEWDQQQRRNLPKFQPGGKTTGAVGDATGNVLHRTVSGRDELSARAELTLSNTDLVLPLPNERQGHRPNPEHVEVKEAQRQADDKASYRVVSVNNAVCRGRYGCGAAIAAILPEGYTMDVWEPGATRPIRIRGRAKP